MKFRLIVLGVILALNSCMLPKNETKIVSMKEPTFDGMTFEKILVEARFAKSMGTQIFEEYIVQMINERGIKAYSKFK